jgi:glyoxylase-like metal-dependent hydrolase (beta-lactamase superfamily II)
LTHAHPDHYLGLEVIHGAFPSAAIVTTPGVLTDFDANAPATLAQLQQNGLTSVIAGSLVRPSPLAVDTITLDGEPLRVVEMPNAGETAHAAALALPGGALISGDLLMNHVHLYLGECHSEGWQQNLDAVKAMGFTTFYPGHGKSPADVSVFADETSYIAGAIPILRAAEGFDASAGDAGDPRVAAAVEEIAAKFPDFESQFVLGFSTSTFIDTNKCP